MDAASANATYLLTLLCLSVVLLVVHILLQGNFATKERGLEWNAGPRDGDNEPKSVMAGRSARASKNFQETYPAFIGLLLAMILTGDTSGWGLIGGTIWLIARIIYIPLYLTGIAYVRSLVWVVSLVGLLLMMIGLFL